MAKWFLTPPISFGPPEQPYVAFSFFSFRSASDSGGLSVPLDESDTLTSIRAKVRQAIIEQYNDPNPQVVHLDDRGVV